MGQKTELSSISIVCIRCQKAFLTTTNNQIDRTTVVCNFFQKVLMRGLRLINVFFFSHATMFFAANLVRCRWAIPGRITLLVTEIFLVSYSCSHKRHRHMYGQWTIVMPTKSLQLTAVTDRSVCLVLQHHWTCPPLAVFVSPMDYVMSYFGIDYQ